MITREQRRHDQAARIANYRASGLSMLAWCTANHFTMNQLKYWLRKTKEDSFPATPTPSTQWVPLTVANQSVSPVSASSLVVCVGSASIELRAGFDPQLLRNIVQALKAPC